MNKVVKAMMTSIWPASAMVGADQAEADNLQKSRGCFTGKASPILSHFARNPGVTYNDQLVSFFSFPFS